MRRRDFIAGFGGAAAWPLAPRAQQRTLPVIGYMNQTRQDANRGLIPSFHQGLAEQSFVVGRNVDIVYAFADNNPDRLAGLVADFVKRNVAVIVASGGPQPALVAKHATATIPIVFETGIDPVASGLVASLNRPGGNVTGINSLIGEAWTKQLDLMAKALPNARSFALMYNGIVPGRLEFLEYEAASAARTLGRKIVVVPATTPQELDDVIPAFPRQGVEALIVTASPFAYEQREKLAALTAQYAIPAMYPFRETVEAGGLMSYGIDLNNSWRLMGNYVGRILKGEKPADLPVQQATKFEFLINLRTAKTLGLSIPPGVLAIVDGVIE
jgi:putative tryptophan/tyrosine transport system substrate-binding protein